MLPNNKVSFDFFKSFANMDPDLIKYSEILRTGNFQAKKQISKTLKTFEEKTREDKRFVVLFYEVYVSTIKKMVPNLNQMLVGYYNLMQLLDLKDKDIHYKIGLLTNLLLGEFFIDKKLFLNNM